jgi:hypothetical protein
MPVTRLGVTIGVGIRDEGSGPTMDDNRQLVVLRTYPARIHAELAKSALVAHEIECAIVGGEFNHARSTPGFPIRLFVRARDAERAIEILGSEESFSI